MIGLSELDGATLIAIFVKALGYGAALLAMGSALFAVFFVSSAGRQVIRLAKRIAVIAALIGLVVLALRFGIRAARISGMGIEGAMDPMMLGFVWQSPLGTAAIWRGLGELAILAIMLPSFGRWIAVGGSLAIAISFSQVGHTLGEPRTLLAMLLVVHMLCAALWVGALAPLRHAARGPEGAEVLHRFGITATVFVGLLIAAGTGLAWLLSGSFEALIGTAYGQGLLAKVALVAGVLALAAVNKWRFVPSLQSGDLSAARALRRSISMEMVVIFGILLMTAAITTATTPAINL